VAKPESVPDAPPAEIESASSGESTPQA
jgi:hypothetical protein